MLSTRRGTIIAAFVIFGVVTSSRHALAEKRDEPAATELFRQGRAAMDRRDYAEACNKLEESEKLDPQVGTLLNLAECLEHLGEPAAALAKWQKAFDLARAKGDAKREAVARKRLEELSPRVPRLTLRLVDSAPPGTAVRRDGVDLGGGSLGTPLPVDPGEYVISVEAPGREARELRVTLELGEAKEIEVAPGPPLPPPSAEDSDSAGAKRNAEPWWRTATLVTGVAGVGLSLATGAWALERKGVVSDHCSGKECDADGASAASTGSALVTISTVAFVVGAAGWTVWFAVPPPSKAEGSETNARSGFGVGAEVTF